MLEVTEKRAQTNGAKEKMTGGTQITKGEENAPARRFGFFPTLWEDNPFVFMRRFANDMERFFEDFGSFRLSPLLRRDVWPRVGEFGRAEWSPEVEIVERDNKLIFRADLPGLNKEDVKVEVADEALIISGERKEEKEEKKEGFYRSERTYGSFFRRILLPEGVKTEEATATFKNGVLEVTMAAPKRELRGRQLEIKEAAKEQAATVKAAM